jgi:hypothetical protein
MFVVGQVPSPTRIDRFRDTISDTSKVEHFYVWFRFEKARGRLDPILSRPSLATQPICDVDATLWLYRKELWR